VGHLERPPSGHRILLEVSGSNFSRFARNGNTGGHVPPESAEQMRPVFNGLFHDAGRASRLILPVIER
jgi:predicted acyl esterase